MQHWLAVQALDIGAAVLTGLPELPLPWLLCFLDGHTPHETGREALPQGWLVL